MKPPLFPPSQVQVPFHPVDGLPSANDVCIVIPQHPEHAVGKELTSEELAVVAGGAVSSGTDATAPSAAIGGLDACSLTACLEPIGVVAAVAGISVIVGGSG
ncbi:MAG: hypothetical protein P8R42_05450 [Candidatus Binatia bacterium]|nr:hypothetical protein [Candidatus Binatia bacterium]